MPMVKPATSLSKKTLPKDSFVTDDGQPKHRYVQQAIPARYGPFWKHFIQSTHMIDYIWNKLNL